MSSVFVLFDLFDKQEENEFVAHTRSGNFISVLLSVITAFWSISAVFAIFKPVYVRDLSIEPKITNEQELVNISLSVLVSMPCFFLHLDVLDTIGFAQLNINNTVTLRRMHKNGSIIGIANSSLADVCYPCYGLLGDTECCNSCEQLILLSILKNRVPTPNQWAQCTKGANTMVYPDEKCLLKGKISVNKVTGSFHIAPGRNVVNQPGHAHDLSFASQNLDLSHRIDRMRFGPKIPRISEPIKNLWMIQSVKIPMVFRYSLMITPIRYIKNGETLKNGYEYTVLATHSPYHNGMGYIPGIFFNYAFTPYTVDITNRNESPLQFISSFFGFLSGAYAIASLIEGIISRNLIESKQL